jgi:hypothetical protein
MRVLFFFLQDRSATKPLACGGAKAPLSCALKTEGKDTKDYTG